ncbi:Lrp/AsnC ligand binding domain-containing protein [Candidatus Bathyarchaeota archaeon]|jgi:DNA-binding Lrp family transcriptional regulator|nr:Lrp/AsnC ligand binding domain-containing protein [Candidatus Bathyarchaeota archaeon]MBT6605192.1 Lrp/AsnC ligand binding domain-containing protein [Candidatus Bathyarchaeota archaeon]MBT7347999.1 Lrp/AsnC ligand binding domain-containing protein [Candidatus Bathyarchaeota archaeon]
MTKESNPHAFIMISCDPGTNEGLLNALWEVPEVIEAYAVYGIYDQMVRVKTGTMAEFRELNARIRRLPNVRSTITMFID